MKFEWNKKYAQITFWVCLVVLFTVVCVFFFLNYNNFGAYAKKIISVLNPIFYGIVIAYVLNKIMKIYERGVFKFLDKRPGRARFKRTLSIVCTYVTVVALIAAFIWLIAPQIIAGITDLRVNIPFYIDSFYEWMYDISDRNSAIYDIIMKCVEYLEELYGKIDEIIATVMPKVTEWLGQIVTFVKDLIIGLILSVYFLMQKERFIAQGKRVARAVFPDEKYGKSVKLVKDIDNSFGGYLVAMGLDSMLVMCECFLLFGICGIPYYPLISFIIGVTNFIPFFGPFIGAIPSAIIIFIAAPAEPMKLLLFIVLIVVIQQIDGNIIAPKIIGSHIGISSVWVVIAITVMSGFFGFIGMVIGVPLFSVIYTIIDNAIAGRLEKKNCDTEIFDFYSENNMGKTMEIEMMQAEERKAQNPGFFDKLFHKLGGKHRHKNKKYDTGETTVTVQEFSTEEFMANYESDFADATENGAESEEPAEKTDGEDKAAQN